MSTARARSFLLDFRRLLRDRAAVVAPTTALLIVPLAIATGLAIDGARMFLVRTQMTQALDAAALAAAASVDAADIAVEAQRVFEANYPAEYMGASVGKVDVKVNNDTGRIEVTARTSMPTVFMQLGHIDSVELVARTVVVREQRGMELALVLDVSGSMCQPCTKRDALKQAAYDLLDIVYGPQDQADDLYVAVVPFNSRVKIGTSRTSWLTTSAPSGWKGCVEQRSGALAYNDTTPSGGKFAPTATSVTYKSGGKNVTYTTPCNTEILPLTASKATVKARVGQIVADGGTRIDIAAGWGWRILSERWKGLWGNAKLPLPDADETNKVVVLMSDGENEVFSPIDGSTTNAQADQSALNTCTAMKAAGYIVYTVAFQAPAAGKSLLQKCASSTANYFDSPTNEDLRRAFRQIGGRLSALRIAE